jgi:hypothetical protein
MERFPYAEICGPGWTAWGEVPLRELNVCCFKMVLEEYFGVNPGSICIDIWSAEESATCCGANLAVAGFGVGFVLLAA